MRARLLDPDTGIDPDADLPPLAGDTANDLEIDTLVAAMAGEDDFITTVARHVLLTPLPDPDVIRYRQAVLRDCLAHPALVRSLYEVVADGLFDARRALVWRGTTPDSKLHGSLSALEVFVGVLRRLRAIVERSADAPASRGLTTLFAALQRELTDEYFTEVDGHLRRLRFRDGVLLSATLGRGNRGTDYVLRRAEGEGWLAKVLPMAREGYGFSLPDHDETGARALADLRSRGVAAVATAAAQSADHLAGFIRDLRTELAFYLGCVNLAERLGDLGQPTSLPDVLPEGPSLRAEGLYDPSLALVKGGEVVGNDVEATQTPVILVTGANQGGKTTFLRSVGLAQLMLQAGMFVPAQALEASVRSGVLTHFPRGEDTTMTAGKLDEELTRMGAIVESVEVDSLVLANESFSSTNEREGSELALQVVRALGDRGASVVFVTHFYELAARLRDERPLPTTFLRAQRGEGGQRPFRLLEGEPLRTSHGQDLYERVFGRPLPARGTRGAARLDG